MEIIREKISRDKLADAAREWFGDMVKAVVDVERGIMAIGGEMHADEESLLLDDGSIQQFLWGINIWPNRSSENWIEFDSMINIRPKQNNRTRGVENTEIREKIIEIVNSLIIDNIYS